MQSSNWNKITKNKFIELSSKYELIEYTMFNASDIYYYDKTKSGTVIDKTLFRISDFNNKKEYYVRTFV